MLNNGLVLLLTSVMVGFIGNTNVSRMDSAEPWQLDFQDPATPMMEGIVTLYHNISVVLIVILGFVVWIMARTILKFNRNSNPIPFKFMHGTALEIVWTITPSLILVAIAVPSFSLLYSMDEIINPAITIKAVGHQWYWSYEYSDYNTVNNESLAFDSYMIPENELHNGQLRLLEVDNRVVVPVNTHIRVIITATDVLHCWAVPSLGVKLDAVPGRLNQTSMFIKREGIYYGQCSEICGVNHGFMPIVVEAVSLDDYVHWITNKLELVQE